MKEALKKLEQEERNVEKIMKVRFFYRGKQEAIYVVGFDKEDFVNF